MAWFDLSNGGMYNGTTRKLVYGTDRQIDRRVKRVVNDGDNIRHMTEKQIYANIRTNAYLLKIPKHKSLCYEAILS